MKKNNLNLNAILVVFLLSLFSCGIMRNNATNKTFSNSIITNNIVSYSQIYWLNSKIDDSVVEKSGLFIPVQVDGIEKELFMQLDLGANISMFYGKTLNSFAILDTVLRNKLFVQKGKHYISDVSIKINNSNKLQAKQIRILNNYGSVNIDTSFVIIGTIGYDILLSGKLIIDYKNNRFAIVKSIPTQLDQNMDYIDDVDLTKFPIILPFRMNNKQIKLFYDTGSSLFPIITGTNRLKKIAKHMPVDTISGLSSWGQQTPIYKLKNAVYLECGNTSFGNVDIYGTDEFNILRLFGKYLYGLTGNVLFLEKTIIIDIEEHRFGISR